MRPISDAHQRLGAALKQVRRSAGLSTRQVRKHAEGEFYSSGHISLVERGCVAPSPELVESYAAITSNKAELHALFELMSFAAQQAGRVRRQAAPRAADEPPQVLDELLTRLQVQSHYVVESHRSAYRFDGAGRISTIDCTVILRAKSRGTKVYAAGYSYSADRRRGVIHIVAGAGAAQLLTRESESGAVECFFELARPLAPDDPVGFPLSFQVEVRSRERSIPRLRYHAADGNKSLMLLADFQAPALPGEVRSFAVADILDTEHLEQLPILESRSPSTFQREFDQLVPGWCYGFAWKW